ncbi:peptidylprolyl isomerase [Bdellovibrio sp. SKB1291214]|uniref:peptidylprolyl isomerase n=1 Tax=Bdellovibrio sp. SKB1291214 TaxID=1732569 RepID=UPI000B515DE2|nr:peptidylprolyl isomerase [Bdellovibrio sp. SKB1291214]UYL10539.1 peptidylprolyl isomerase [Bdellovibrio sp. SKB1291214]
MISLLVSLFLAVPVKAEVVEKTLAVVNNEIILESDLKELQNRISKPGMIDDALLDGKSADSLKKDRKAQMDYLINEKIISSEIKRLNLSVTNDRVENEFKDMAKRNNVAESELISVLKGQGINIAEYKTFLKEKIEKQNLMDTEIISKLRISDEDALNEYLKSNPNNKPAIDEFSVSHIFFNPKKGGSEAAYKRAETALSKLRSGENFENLAQQFSEDPNFSAGGALGSFKSGEFLPEIEEAIGNLKVGETTGIVKSRLGFHIVKLTTKKLTPDPKFEKQKDRIKAQLMEASFKRQLRLWLQNKRDDSFVRINE